MIVLFPMIINAHAGTRYGIPFPVYRARRLRPARCPSAGACCAPIVACGWFGIQTWIGGLAISALIGFLWPGWAEPRRRLALHGLRRSGIRWASSCSG